MNDIPGNRPSNRAAVLTRVIPPGGFGRLLTSAERRRLRALGWVVSERAIVVRSGPHRLLDGIVYRPNPRRLGGGFNHSGVYVTLR